MVGVVGDEFKVSIHLVSEPSLSTMLKLIGWADTVEGDQVDVPQSHLEEFLLLWI